MRSIWIMLQQALTEREQFQQQNYQLQNKLAEYFRKKKSDDARQDVDKNVTDQEQRYLKYMCEYNNDTFIRTLNLEWGLWNCFFHGWTSQIAQLRVSE